MICLAVAADISSTLVVPTSGHRTGSSLGSPKDTTFDKRNKPKFSTILAYWFAPIVVRQVCRVSTFLVKRKDAQKHSQPSFWAYTWTTYCFHSDVSSMLRNSNLFQQKPDTLCSLPDILSRWCKGCNSLHLRFSQCQQWFSGSFQTTLVPSEVRFIKVPNKVGRHCPHHQQLVIPNSHQDNCLDLKAISLQGPIKTMYKFM